MINYPDKFKQAQPAGFDGVFDWDFLLPAFKGTNIKPMDIDGTVERKGKILLYETKDPDKQIPLGQTITLNTFLEIGLGKINVFVLYGKTPSEIVGMEEWFWGKNSKGIYTINHSPIVECNADYVLERTSQWFKWANSK